MRGVLRGFVVVLTSLVLAPASASADATVDNDPATGVITIVEDLAAADDIMVVRNATQDVVSRVGGGLTAGLQGSCSGGPNTVRWPPARASPSTSGRAATASGRLR